MRGASWTTDVPLRETAPAIAVANAAGIHAVEMEAAALYAYATARQRDVICIAHVTNTMAARCDDFEKATTTAPIGSSPSSTFECRVGTWKLSASAG
jgi:purine-nucleoside phosphorylase